MLPEKLLIELGYIIPVPTFPSIHVSLPYFCSPPPVHTGKGGTEHPVTLKRRPLLACLAVVLFPRGILASPASIKQVLILCQKVGLCLSTNYMKIPEKRKS